MKLNNYKSMFLIKFIIIQITIIILVGCVSDERAMEIFKTDRDWRVGHSISNWLNVSHNVNSLKNDKKEYFFTNDNGCIWSFITDSNGVILSWRYISDPSLCQLRPNYLAPF